jgi:hypothetical protein
VILPCPPPPPPLAAPDAGAAQHSKPESEYEGERGIGGGRRKPAASRTSFSHWGRAAARSNQWRRLVPPSMLAGGAQSSIGADTIRRALEQCDEDNKKEQGRRKKRPLPCAPYLLHKLSFDLSLLIAGLRDAVLVDYYNCAKLPPLQDVLGRLHLQTDLAVVCLLNDDTPFLVRPSLIEQKLKSLSISHHVFLDVSESTGISVLSTNDIVPWLQKSLEPLVLLAMANDVNVGLPVHLGAQIESEQHCRCLHHLGLCGLAGWLLGYPVVYCCAAHDKNCLAMRCLDVYELWLKPCGGERMMAFSFSIPQHDDLHATFQESLNFFQLSIEKRLAMQSLFAPEFKLNTRQEILPIVAL